MTRPQQQEVPDYDNEVRLAAEAYNRAEEGYALADEESWRVADRTLAVCGPSARRGGNGGGPRRGGHVALTRWSADVQRVSRRPFSVTTATYYRDCAEYRNSHRGESCDRHATPHSFHDTMDHVRSNTSADRWNDSHERGILNTPLPVRERTLEQLSQQTDMQPAVHEQAVRLVAEHTELASQAAVQIARQQPEALDAMLRDRPARAALFGAERRHGAEIIRENEQRREEMRREDPVLARLDEMQASLDLQQEVDHISLAARRIVQDILPRMGALPEAQRDPLAMRMMLQSAYDDCMRALEPIGSLLRTGHSDLDQFLSDVLSNR